MRTIAATNRSHPAGPPSHTRATIPPPAAAAAVAYDGVSFETSSAAPRVTSTVGQRIGLASSPSIAPRTPSEANNQALSTTTVAARTHLSCDRLTGGLQLVHV